ncbi:MAG: cytochrome oxidase subunit III [SAR202 cluster bacterium Io17-Chloro-G3]|nr:MAG: cytochrome oxidase subunit III [SAR202 cluster bacterium Io17-Chloro-G3]
MAHVSLTEHTAETTTGLDNRKLVMWLFLASECLFFGSLISTYLVYLGKSLVGPYPHDVFNIPYTSVSAFVLLMSSLTMVLALAALQRGDHRGLRIWLMATALLGIVFLGGQTFEFTVFVRDGVTLSSNLFGSTFFVLTGFHGAHVTVGVIMLLSFWVLSMRGKVSQAQSLNIEMLGLYWHFVDIVWIIIFTVIYLFEAPNIVG